MLKIQFLSYISHNGSIHVASGFCISTEMMKHFCIITESSIGQHCIRILLHYPFSDQLRCLVKGIYGTMSMDSLREGRRWEWFDLAAQWCRLKQGFFSIFPFSRLWCPLCGYNTAVNISLVCLLLHQDYRSEWGGHSGSPQKTTPHLSLASTAVGSTPKPTAVG